MAQAQIGYAGSAIVISPESSQLRDVVRLAEESGLDHIGIGDHVSFHVGFGADALLKAGVVLGATDRLRVVIGVYLLPLRHPTTVARQLADLAQLAPGRLTFGVGVGGEDPAEFTNCDIDPATRGKRTDEAIDIVRGLLTGERLDYDGAYYQLEGAQIAPPPTEPIPLVVGGRSDAAVRRAALKGDGWLGIWVSPRRFGDVVAQMDEIAGEAGRVEVPWRNGLNIWCGTGPTRDDARARVSGAMQNFYQMPFEPFEKWSPYGSADDIAEFVAPYVDAGCTEFNLLIIGPDPETEIATAAAVKKLVTG